MHCWIPAELLDDPEEFREEDPDGPVRREFDLWLEELDSPMARALVDDDELREAIAHALGE